MFALPMLGTLRRRLGLGGHPAGVWALFAATLVNRCGTMVLPFLALYLTGERGFGTSDAGAVLAWYGGGALVAGPVGGRLADRFGAQRVMVASLLASGTALAMFPLARSMGAIACATVGLALTSETFRTASQSAVGALAAPERRRTSFALIRLAINLGMSVGPIVGGLLVTRAPVALFVIDGATSIAAAFVLLAWGTAGARGSPAVGPAPQSPEGPESSYPLVSSMTFALATFLFGCVFFQGDASMPIFLVRDLGLSSTFFGITFSVNAALILAFELPLTSTTLVWPHTRTLTVGALLCAAGFGGFVLVRGAAGALAAVAVWTFGEMMLFPALPAFIADVAPAPRIGAHMGVFGASLGLAFAVGPYVGLRTLDRFGPTTLWTGCAACGSLAALLFYAVARSSIPRQPEAAIP